MFVLALACAPPPATGDAPVSEPTDTGTAPPGTSPGTTPDPTTPPDGGHTADPDALHTGDGAHTAEPPTLPEEVPCGSFPYADPLLAEREGFGAGARGGDPGHVVRVTNLDDDGPGSLREAVESDEDVWVVFDVDGTIELDDRLHLRSRITVDGRGRDVTVVGNWELADVHDVIVTDLKLRNPSSSCDDGDDVITVKGTDCGDAATCTSHDLWFHHLELFEGGDGLLDLRGATNVTVSWTHLRDHVKGILAWQDSDGLPATGMDATFHHDWFDRVTRRGPQFQYGRAHLYNNWQFEWYEYGAGSLDEAQLLSEANVYEARSGTFCLFPCPDPNTCGDDDFDVSKDGLVTEWDGRPGKVKSVGDLALNGARLRTRDDGAVFPQGVPYTYVAEPADAALTARLQAETGPRTVATCP